MDLIAEAKQNNEQLLLQNASLQQLLCKRGSAPAFSSYLVTFILTPFIVGAAAQVTLSSKGPTSNWLHLAALPWLRFWPVF